MRKLPVQIILLLFLGLLANAAWAQKTLLVFGDSLSAGYGMSVEFSWPSLLQQQLPKYKVVNASVSGETTLGGKQRLGKLLTQHQPEIVIIELGANDALRGNDLAQSEANLAQMIAMAQQQKAKVILAGMKLPPNYGMAYVGQFEQMYQRLSKKYQLKLLPFLLDGVRAEQFQADNLHPSKEAQAQIRDNVWKVLRGML